jgi:hypothetical protein
VNTEERSAAPSGAEQTATSLRWLFAALLGTTAVFLTAVGSRRVLNRRQVDAGGGIVLTPILPAPAAPAAPTAQNGSRTSEQVPVPVVAAPPPREGLPGTCEIRWSRGYFKSDFYVATPEPEGGVSEVARSPAFRWTAPEEPPQDETIIAAHTALVERLVALGWEEVGAGESWYARRYRLRADVESVR